MKRTIVIPVVIAVVALGTLTLGVLVIARSYGPAVVQPLAFNHKKHLEKEVVCTGCHDTVEKSAAAGKPRLETCMLCHETPLGQTAEEEQVRQYAARGEEIRWGRLYKLPEHVFFPHQSHVVGAKIECKTCHGTIGESVSPPKRPEIKLTMNDCITCHRSSGVTTDCIACHK
jgi:hypothetical protein